MNKKRLLFGILLLFALAANAQIKKGFKHLDDREFDQAASAFKIDLIDPDKAHIAAYGLMKAYANSKDYSDWFRGLEYYKHTRDTFATLDKKEQEKLADKYNLTLSAIDNAYSTLYGKYLGKLEKTPNSCQDFKLLSTLGAEPPKSLKTRYNTFKNKCDNPPAPKPADTPAPAAPPAAQYVDRAVPADKPFAFLHNINTEGNEAVPVLSADGTTMYLVGEKRSDNIDGEDIFYSERQPDGTWGESKIFPFFNDKGHQSVISASADGNALILFIQGKPYISYRTRNAWGKPVPIELSLPFVWIGTANISRNGEILFFEAISTTSSDVDIYFTQKLPDGRWDIPVRLNETINTPNNDRTPFLHSDFKTLYFSSIRTGGFGGLDVYKTTRLDDSWQHWSAPQNIGSGINTHADEWGFFIPPSGDIAYFATQLNGYDDQDIVTAPLLAEARPEPQLVIIGKLTDAQGHGLPSDIIVEDAATEKQIQKLRSRPDGYYTFSIPSDSKVYYYATGDSVITMQKTYIDAAAEKQPVKEETLKVLSAREVLNDKKAIELHDILFETGKSVLQTQSKAEIKRVYENLKRFSWSIEVGGHTDNVGSDAANQTLSEQRAKAVSDYLISLGYPAARISSKGYGASAPVDTNDTEQGRTQNRRVEIKIK